MINQLERKKGNLSIILLWGALWGITEATVGYLLHALPFRVPTGTVLFPIGYYFMQKSFKATNDIKSIIYTSLIAGLIKLVNLFMATMPAIKVLNPAACIVLEGLVVLVILNNISYENKSIKFVHALAMSLAWRIGYYILCFTTFIPLNMMDSSSILNTKKIIEFFVINGIINSILIYGYSRISFKEKEVKINYNLALSSLIFALALLLEWKL